MVKALQSKSVRSFAGSVSRAVIRRETAFARPKKNQLAQAMIGAYGEDAAPEGYELVKQTPTLKFYRNKLKPKDVVLGVRGSKDFTDWKANALLGLGFLGTSKRYRRDKEALAEYLKTHPDAEITTSGHSLGGAVARELARDFDKNIKAGVGYNSAIALNELLNPALLRKGKQVRYTTKYDPLRLVSLPFLRKRDSATVVADKPGMNPHNKGHFDATGLGV